MIDWETRWPEAVPTNSITAKNIASIVLREWVARFGIPVQVSTDCGRQFISELFQQFAAKLGARKIRTTAYHPRANGKVA